jgi:hypothetical protein
MSNTFSYCIFVLGVTFLVLYASKFMLNIPQYRHVNEAFYGGAARGTGHPDCLRTIPESSELLQIIQRSTIQNRPPGFSEGNADYKEFELILSKMACLKKDLLSPSGIVDATRYQAFDTQHDRINVADLCGLCNSQNLSARDLDIVFATWRDRGNVLLRKLCTEANLTHSDIVKAEKIFMAIHKDVYEISTSKCLKTDFSLQNGGSTKGGDVCGYEAPTLVNYRDYTNMYGGLYASGWNGAV